MQLELVQIPAGTVTIGVDEKQREEAQRISELPPIWWEAVSPAVTQDISAFQITRAPLSVGQLLDVRPGYRGRAGESASQVARVRWEVANSVANELGGRLPTEAEWEYACRGGRGSLFSFGEMPSSDSDLDPWMSWDTSGGPQNGYGLRCLYTGEWCSGFWSLRSGPDLVEEEARIMRGGGAFFWPWQDEEWVWCMSAARAPSTELTDPEWSFRVVIDV